MQNKNKLQVKDLINTGLFTAIYFIIITIIAMFGYIPIMMPLLVVIAPLVAGIPFMLFLTKVKKFGMILIMSIIVGLLLLLTGMSWYSLAVGVITGLICELIMAKTNYSSKKAAIIIHGVFGIILWANFIPLFLFPDVYFSTRQNFGQEYIDTLSSLLPMYMMPILLIVTIVCGFIGGLIGESILKKHFVKAGLV